MSDHPIDLTRLFAPVARIDQYLAEVLDDPQLDLAPALREAMKYAVLNGGKRLRPLLAWYCCEALGAPGEASLPAGTAVEFVHAFSLVHDDLPALDNDDLRRGKPTLHKHAGEAMAILAGDALLNLAYKHLLRAKLIPDALVDATASMINGQVRDTFGVREPRESPEQTVKRIHDEKTGALILAATMCGLQAANVWRVAHKLKHSPIKELVSYSVDVGLLYQIVDDLIDIEQSSDSAGKRTGKDTAAGKLTYPAVFGIEKSKAEVARLKSAALEAIAPLGPPAQPLRDLAHYLATRTR